MADPHEDLVAFNRRFITAHEAECARLAAEDPDAGKIELSPEDQAVLDAKVAVEEAQANLIAAQQAAYTANIERADAAVAKAVADAEAEKSREEAVEEEPLPLVEGKPPLTPMPQPASFAARDAALANRTVR
jgi:hypothetical protein